MENPLPRGYQEAVFVGRGDALIACGSDDGRVFIYCAETGLLLRAIQADEDVVNCVQVGLIVAKDDRLRYLVNRLSFEK